MALIRLILVRLVCLVCTQISWVHAVQADTINVSVLEFCPYVCDPLKENGKLGFTVDIEKVILERAGHQVNFDIVPYARSLKGTELGIYDAVGICNDHSSEVNICSSETIGPMIYTFYVLKDQPWRYTGIESIKQIVLGTIAGYNLTQISPEYQDYVEEHENEKKRVHIHHGKGDLVYRMFKKVELGRIDTFSEASYVAQYYLNTHNLADKFVDAGRFKKTLWGRICFSPKNPKAQEYVELIDKGVRKMRATGELQTIMESYGLGLWESEIKSK
ncbi:transporter substrate-binding domain-containing protein [Vibrio hannami]|uniref:substrate-binding periplasmic protein n=1 Tax=Vibrio hannami TaxID=2717094 RepID=UPI00241008D1|nr:transporter substrate-binding domain-containing protein [Vibrio hannami]MDG3085738.1 transporter substrate-binding domain-containing protein [Vibrio hannami]